VSPVKYELGFYILEDDILQYILYVPHVLTVRSFHSPTECNKPFYASRTIGAYISKEY
jgi:hypothetical protein